MAIEIIKRENKIKQERKSAEEEALRTIKIEKNKILK